jgi:phage terminase large subunit-like protein
VVLPDRCRVVRGLRPGQQRPDDPGGLPANPEGEQQEFERRRADVDGADRQPRPEAEFLLVAPTLEIAGIAFKQAKGTIKIDPDLDKLFQIQDHVRKVTHRRTGATLQIKAADTDVITGSKATGTMIDETHVFAKRSNAKEVFVELRGALTKRPDGFLYQTTTQSKTPPASECSNPN